MTKFVGNENQQEEIWKDVLDYEGLYQVSSYGKINSLANGFTRKEKTIQTYLNREGYIVGSSLTYFDNLILDPLRKAMFFQYLS
ncbi:NUMOD4 domain-containing protein [Brevibacillus sp. NPDC058079]|uniref:NUMOD4 domain-containing protein n=1 Tax=Brevibacillus sp. NPDC058079 TaxID=3346330 RepID=UPI0036EB7659